MCLTSFYYMATPAPQAVIQADRHRRVKLRDLSLPPSAGFRVRSVLPNGEFLVHDARPNGMSDDGG